VKIWYLYHSGFAVQTSGHFFVFDYWRDAPKGAGLDRGVVDPAAIRDQNVVVFASHGHPDHFNRKVFEWKQTIPGVRFILSDDMRPYDGAFMTGPGNKLDFPDFSVETLASNDEGVAFIVSADDLRIFHAGDLNWWHWEGEPDEDNDWMASSFKTEIDKLSKAPDGSTLPAVDLAFIPVDPRLEMQYAWAIDHLMRTTDVKYVVPMHFGNDTSIVARLLTDPVSQGYRDRILGFTKRGEMREIQI